MEAHQLMDAYAERTVDLQRSNRVFLRVPFARRPLHNWGMRPDNIATIKTGLRVLAAMSDKINPALGDVQELRRFAPECSALPNDELACVVVQRAVKKRAVSRAVDDVFTPQHL